MALDVFATTGAGQAISTLTRGTKAAVVGAPVVDQVSFHGTSDIDSRRAVLRALSVLIRETGAMPIAEGVESVDDLRLVRDLGFVAAQGFLLRAPASVPDLTARPLEQLLVAQAVPTG